MTFYTVTEFNTMKLYELDNVTYNKIHNRFANLFGDKMAKTFLEKHLAWKLKSFLLILLSISWIASLFCEAISIPKERK